MTAGDVRDRLIDFAGADGDSDRIVRQARRAIQDALREFPGLHRWTYHYTHGRLQLNAQYQTGTVQYTQSTRALTLTGGTWPAYAGGCDIRIGDIVSEVASRDSGTQLTLSATVNPGQDISAGAGFTLYQDLYTLPADFLASDHAIAESRFGNLQYVGVGDWLWAIRTAEREGTPLYYTFVPDRYIAGRYAFRVWPFPDVAQTLDFIYQRRMRGIRYDSVSAGTATVTGGQSTVTGVGTNWLSDMVGSTIRLGYDPIAVPTGPDGGSPAAFESKITVVTSPTSITVADQAPSSLAGVAYVVSDPLDLEDGVMASCFCWQAISHMADELRMKEASKIQATAMETLIRAKEHDARNFSRQVAGPNGMRRPSRRYMPTGPDEG